MSTKPLRIRPFPGFATAWTRTSPHEGEPDCLCAFCGTVIGVPDDDPRLEDHDEECPGCELCDGAIRLWRGEGDAMEEIRFHTACFQMCVEAA